MNPRFLAILESAKSTDTPVPSGSNPLKTYGDLVFTRVVAEQMLPSDVFHNLVDAMDGVDQLKPEYAESIAVAVKDWALAKGATHYTHWFHPMTGASAEKHDSFIEPGDKGFPIERFTAKELLLGEPDASSFPSGGLRSTYEARGYTGWDPTSPIFIWKRNSSLTLCIPSIYFSWTGDVLDSKIPLLRSEKAVSDACLRLLKLTRVPAKKIFTTLGCEQEYFIVNRSLFNLRPDLVQTGRTLFGKSSPKGQELQDHYLGNVKDRVLDFMRDFEEAAFEVGIPVKTRHNEVAPGQYEVAPLFERASVAVDHNILLMEMMRKKAAKHGLACLVHEKPFAPINGSGKHCNWSLSTDRGLNLLNPVGLEHHNDLHFLLLLTAILQGVHRHAGLLRASIASASNDHRLGGHEAPPAIISVYLGNELESFLDEIEKGKFNNLEKNTKTQEVAIQVIPPLPKDTADRNRTSPFAFTGNKFEFRAVGSSANPAFSITVLNALTAESLTELLDEIEKLIAKGEKLFPATLKVVRKSIIASKPIRFSGDNYTKEWQKEAARRKLPIMPKSVDSFPALISPSTRKLMKGILTPDELGSRYEIFLEAYYERMLIEARCVLDMLRTQIIPTAIKEIAARAKSLDRLQGLKIKSTKEQKKELETITATVEEGIRLENKLNEYLSKIIKMSAEKKAESLSKEGTGYLERIREVADTLESHVSDELWPLPKYRELLFIL